jgi:hypothetical protein
MYDHFLADSELSERREAYRPNVQNVDKVERCVLPYSPTLA